MDRSKGHGSIISSSRSKRVPCFIVLARRLRSSSRSPAFFSRQRNRRDFGRTRVKLSPRSAAAVMESRKSRSKKPSRARWGIFLTIAKLASSTRRLSRLLSSRGASGRYWTTSHRENWASPLRWRKRMGKSRRHSPSGVTPAQQTVSPYFWLGCGQAFTRMMVCSRSATACELPLFDVQVNNRPIRRFCNAVRDNRPVAGGSVGLVA